MNFIYKNHMKTGIPPHVLVSQLYAHTCISSKRTPMSHIHTHTYTSVHPQAYVCIYTQTCIPFMHLHTPSCKPIHPIVHILKYLYAGRHKIPIYPYTHLYLHRLFIHRQISLHEHRHIPSYTQVFSRPIVSDSLRPHGL